MSRFTRLALFVGLIVALAGPATAAVYYVSPTGNDGAAGTAAAPFLTVQHGLSVLAAPGDVLNIGAGTYIGNGTVGMTIAVSGAAGNPIIVQASDATRPTLQNMAFLTTGSYLTFNNLIMDGSKTQESSFDLTRPGTNLVINSCDFRGTVDDPLLNSYNTAASVGGEDIQDDAGVRIWGASSVTINDCDFYSSAPSPDNYAVMVTAASGNTIDATGMDTSVYSDLTITNCNNFGKPNFVTIRRPMENISITNCESVGNDLFFFERVSQRIGSNIRQKFLGPGANAANVGTTARNLTIKDCSATCARMAYVYDASKSTSGEAGNFLFENLTVNILQTGAAVQHTFFLNHDTVAGIVPTNNGWTGRYVNVTYRNITVNDPIGGGDADSVFLFGSTSSAAGFFENLTVQSVSAECRNYWCRFGYGFGGKNVLFTGNTMESHNADGILSGFHTTASGCRITDITVTNNVMNVRRIGLYLYSGNSALPVKAGFDNFWVTNNTMNCETHAGILLANGAATGAPRVVVHNWYVSGNVIDSSDGDNVECYPIWLQSTHTDGSNVSSNWNFTSNTVRNNSRYGWGTLRTDSHGAGGGVIGFNITNNNFTCGWFGIVIVGSGGAGLGYQNLVITGNTLQNGNIPVGWAPNQVNDPYGGCDFAAAKVINGTVMNNTMINLRPIPRVDDRNAPTVWEQGTNFSANNTCSNVRWANNTALGLWNSGAYVRAGLVTGSTIEDTIFAAQTCHGRLLYMYAVQLDGLTVRNIDTKNSISQFDCIWLLETQGSSITLQDLRLDGSNQPDHDWAGIWGTSGQATPQNGITVKNLVIRNTGGPGILLTGGKNNVTIQDTLIINAGAKSQTGPAGNSGWGIQVEGANNSNFNIVNNAIINASAGIKLQASFSTISGNVIGLRNDTTQNGIEIGGQVGNTDITVRRNGVAGPGVAPAGIAAGTGIAIEGGFRVISSSISNNTFAGFANGAVVKNGTNVKLWNNAFAEITGTGLTVTPGCVGTLANFNGYNAGTNYSGIAAGANDQTGNLRLASNDPTSNNFFKPMTSPPSPLINAGSGDGGATPDGVTDIGYREGGSVGPAAPAGFTAPWCFLSDATGNDANDGLTTGTAVKTWAVALTKVPGGGTIYVMDNTPGGAYPAGVVTISNVASESTPLLIRPSTGTTPIVKERFDLVGASHVWFDGLTLDVAAQHRFCITTDRGSSDLTVTNCIFDNALGGPVITAGGTADPAYPTADVPAGRNLNMFIGVFGSPNTWVDHCTFKRNNVTTGQGSGNHYSLGVEWWSQTLGLEGQMADPNVGVTDVLHGMRITYCDFIATANTPVNQGYGCVARRGINDYIIDHCNIVDTANPLLYLRSANSATVPRSGGFGPWGPVELTNCVATCPGNSGYNTLARFELASMHDLLIADCTASSNGNPGTDCPVYFTATGYENDSRVTNCTIRDCSFSGNDYCMIVDEYMFTNWVMENCKFNSWGHPTGGGSVWYWTYSVQAGDQAYCAYNPWAWHNVRWSTCEFVVANTRERRVINMQVAGPNVTDGVFENLLVDGTRARETAATTGGAWFWQRGICNNVLFKDITLYSNLVLGSGTSNTNLYTDGYNTGRGWYFPEKGYYAPVYQRFGDITFENCRGSSYFAMIENTGSTTTNVHRNFTVRNCDFLSTTYEAMWGADGDRTGTMLIEDSTLTANRMGAKTLLWGGQLQNLVINRCAITNLGNVDTGFNDLIYLQSRTLNGRLEVTNSVLTEPNGAGLTIIRWDSTFPDTNWIPGHILLQNLDLHVAGFGVYMGGPFRNVTIRDVDTSVGAPANSQNVEAGPDQVGDYALYIWNDYSHRLTDRGALLVEDCTLYAGDRGVETHRARWTSMTVQNCDIRTDDDMGVDYRFGYEKPIVTLTVQNCTIECRPGPSANGLAVGLYGTNNFGIGEYTRINTLNVLNNVINADDYGVAQLDTTFVGTMNINNNTINTNGTGVYTAGGQLNALNMDSNTINAVVDGVNINETPLLPGALDGLVNNCVISTVSGAGMRLSGDVNGLTVQNSTIQTYGTDYEDGADGCVVFEGASLDPANANTFSNVAITNNVLTGGTSGVAFQPAGYGVTGASGILLAANNMAVSNVTISDNTVAYQGVWGVAVINATGGGNVAVTGNLFHDYGSGLVYAATPHDPTLFPTPGAAIAMSGGMDGVTITGNQIDGSGTGSGISMGDLPAGAGAALTNVTITGNVMGNVVGNTAIGVGAGATVTAATNCLHSLGKNGPGLDAAGDGSTLSGNTVINFDTGASVTGNNNNVFSNIFADCNTGVNLSGTATGNVLKYNGFVGNTANGVGYTPSGGNGDVVSASTTAQEIVSVDPYNANFCQLTASSSFLDVGSYNGVTMAVDGLDMGAVQSGYLSGIDAWRQF